MKSPLPADIDRRFGDTDTTRQMITDIAAFQQMIDRIAALAIVIRMQHDWHCDYGDGDGYINSDPWEATMAVVPTLQDPFEAQQRRNQQK